MNTKLKIAVHYHEDAHPDSFSRKWIEEFKKRDVDVVAIDFRTPDLIEKIRDCNGAMWHWFHIPEDKQIAPKILESIETGLKVPVFPNLATRWHYDDKLAQHFFLEAVKAPKIKTWVFWKYDEAIDFIQTCNYPIVFKLSVGAGAANVLKLENCAAAENIVCQIFDKGILPYTMNEFIKEDLNVNPANHWYYLLQKNYVYFQEFLAGNAYDIRITVIGDRAFGFIRYNRLNDFRASGSGNIDYDIKKVPLEAVKIAHQISEENGFQSMAYDFLYSKDSKLLVNEISYCYVNKAVYNCSGFWDRSLDWHEGHVHPEEVQVEDFIHYIQTGRLK